MSRIARSVFVPFLAVAVAVCGCGDGRPSLVPVTGTVTLNGEPLAGAQVGFLPQDIDGYARPSTATTGASGDFAVGTFGTTDGIPEGTYLVTVQKSEIVGKIPDDYNTEEPEANARPLKMKLIVPAMYKDPESSGLTVTVTSDGLMPETIALEGDPEMQIGGINPNDP